MFQAWRAAPCGMLRQTAKYAVARWAPGIVNFAAIMLYTRLLSQEEYGVYAVAVACVALTNALAYQWLRSGVRRFLIAYRDSRAEFLGTVTRSFAGLSPMLGLGILAAVLLQEEADRRALVAVGGLLLVTLAWVELNLEIVLADLKPGRYGVATMVRSVASLAGGAGLASLGFGVVGVVAGIALGYLVAGTWLGFLHRTVPSGHENLPGMQGELLRYGLPLTLTFALDFIVSSSDRLLLGVLAGVAAAGAYSAAYDLAQQGMTALMMTVNLGAFPMAVRAMETGGPAALQAQLKRHAVILLGLALPASVALVVLGPTLASVALGSEFRSAAAALIPIVGIAALAGGLKAYYFDLAFQLGRDTRRQVWVSGAAAIANVVLIPGVHSPLRCHRFGVGDGRVLCPGSWSQHRTSAALPDDADSLARMARHCARDDGNGCSDLAAARLARSDGAAPGLACRVVCVRWGGAGTRYRRHPPQGPVAGQCGTDPWRRRGSWTLELRQRRPGSPSAGTGPRSPAP